eukprot:6475374-Amphidinium_carterae.1
MATQRSISLFTSTESATLQKEKAIREEGSMAFEALVAHHNKFPCVALDNIGHAWVPADTLAELRAFPALTIANCVQRWQYCPIATNKMHVWLRNWRYDCSALQIRLLMCYDNFISKLMQVTTSSHLRPS